MALIKKVTNHPVLGPPVTRYYFLGIPVKEETTIKESESLSGQVKFLIKAYREQQNTLADFVLRLNRLEDSLNAEGQLQKPKKGNALNIKEVL